jgi:hypothetical protein
LFSKPKKRSIRMSNQNLETLNKRIRNLIIWLVVIAVINLITIAMLENMLPLIDVGIFAVCIFFIAKFKSRVAGIIVLADFIIGKLIIIEALIKNPIALIIAIIFTIVLIRGVTALFAFKKAELGSNVENKETGSETKPKAIRGI